MEELEQENSSPNPKPSQSISKKLRTIEKKRQIGENQGWVCIYCRLAGTPDIGPDGRMWHLDHLYAESKGGDFHDDNLVLSCATCNLKKSAALLSDFLRKMTPANA
jgi:5-methylcytosine-specific restriction endonuclease McrA